jgi:hypothetical protein
MLVVPDAIPTGRSEKAGNHNRWHSKEGIRERKPVIYVQVVPNTRKWEQND